MKNKLKTWGVIIAFCVAAWLFWQLVAEFLWMCYRAGIPM